MFFWDLRLNMHRFSFFLIRGVPRKSADWTCPRPKSKSTASRYITCSAISLYIKCCKTYFQWLLELQPHLLMWCFVIFYTSLVLYVIEFYVWCIFMADPVLSINYIYFVFFKYSDIAIKIQSEIYFKILKGEKKQNLRYVKKQIKTKT